MMRGSVVFLSTSAVMFKARWRSTRRMVVKLLATLTSATRAKGISSPALVRTRIVSSVARLRR